MRYFKTYDLAHLQMVIKIPLRIGLCPPSFFLSIIECADRQDKQENITVLGFTKEPQITNINPNLIVCLSIGDKKGNGHFLKCTLSE